MGLGCKPWKQVNAVWGYVEDYGTRIMLCKVLKAQANVVGVLGSVQREN